MKKWLKIGLGIILTLVVIFIGISAYLGYSMTRTNRLPLEGNPDLLGLKYENISFPSMDDDLTLHGWLLPNENSKQIIIMVHGDGANRADPTIGMLEIASRLVISDYNVLVFDLRGCGESDGNMVSGGYK